MQRSLPPDPARRAWARRALLGAAAAAAVAAGALFALSGPASAEQGGDDYVISVEAPSLTVGAEGTVVVRIKALEPYHYNHEYPGRVTVADGALHSLDLAKREFRQLSGEFEISKMEGVVRIPVTARAAGRDSLSLDLRFSVCNDKVCLIKRDTAAIAVTVTP